MGVRRVIRQVDMMPMIDVILVVLFVFATIEEGSRTSSSDAQLRTQTTTQETIAAKSAEIDRLIQEMQALRTSLNAAPTQEQVDAATAQATAESQRVKALKQEVADKKDSVKAKSQAIKKLSKENRELQRIKAVIENKQFTAENLQRLESLIEHLLKQNIVTEIEISGAENNCCYRQDPQKNTWEECGVVPTRPSRDWLSGAEAQVLRHVLESTKSGNAITIVRQDGEASDRISFRLQKAISESISGRKVYDDGVSSLPRVRCSDHEPNPFLIP